MHNAYENNNNKRRNMKHSTRSVYSKKYSNVEHTNQ